MDSTESNDHIDYKARCEELAAQNVSLTTEVESLTKVCDLLKGEVEKWKRQHDDAVAIHNEVRDQLMTILVNSRFYTSAQLSEQQRQIEQAKAQLLQKQQKKQ